MSKKLGVEVGDWVAVGWEDACATNYAWTDWEDFDHGLVHIQTVGTCVHIDKKSITVALNVSDDKLSDTIDVPLCWTTKIRKLRVES